MKNKANMLTAAGVGAAVATLLPPVVGSKTRNAITTSVRHGWRFVSRQVREAATTLHLVSKPAKKTSSSKRTTRKPVARSRKAS